MCTAIHFHQNYFGRTLDLEHGYQERVTVTPRNFPLPFRKAPSLKKHHAIIGMATVSAGYPLYYDAINEKGLGMAGLNFPGNAVYQPQDTNKENIAPFELIPWVLGQCETVEEARRLLQKTNLFHHSFSAELPVTPLHWMIADQKEALTLEPMQDGLHILENPMGVLTNNPPFEMQLFSLNNYMNLSKETPENRFSDQISLKTYSRGMGAMGLPGDVSSASRFVRATFTKLNALLGESKEESISQFFHILDTVIQTKGCVHLGEEQYEYTRYASCCDLEQGVYYYTTYENRQITAIDLRQEDADGMDLICYPLVVRQQVMLQNEKKEKASHP